MKAVEWLGDKLRILDQGRLPDEEVYLDLLSFKDIACAISNMNIRGAPAIGVAAGYGIALGTKAIKVTDINRFQKELSVIIDFITSTRPTARNLFSVVERMKHVATIPKDVEDIKKALVDESIKIHLEEERATESISQLGAELIDDFFGVLTHCNTGPLATTGAGTALGVIVNAYNQGKRIRVIATETRPRLQGAKLTAWEMKQAGVPFTLITDSMAGYFMSQPFG